VVKAHAYWRAFEKIIGYWFLHETFVLGFHLALQSPTVLVYRLILPHNPVSRSGMGWAANFLQLM
jgi:hypothetical protein